MHPDRKSWFTELNGLPIFDPEQDKPTAAQLEDLRRIYSSFSHYLPLSYILQSRYLRKITDSRQLNLSSYANLLRQAVPGYLEAIGSVQERYFYNNSLQDILYPVDVEGGPLFDLNSAEEVCLVVRFCVKGGLN